MAQDKITYSCLLAGILLGIYEKSSAQPNVFLLIVAIAIFMFGMMRLSAKVPSKNQDKDE